MNVPSSEMWDATKSSICPLISAEGLLTFDIHLRPRIPVEGFFLQPPLNVPSGSALFPHPRNDRPLHIWISSFVMG